MSGSGTKCGGKCGGWEAPYSNVATREVDGIWFCEACAEGAHRALYEGQDQATQFDICFTSGCGNSASDYIAQQDNPALRLPICEECALHFRRVEMIYHMYSRLCPTCAAHLKDATMRADLTRSKVEIKVNVCGACKPILAGQQEN